MENGPIKPSLPLKYLTYNNKSVASEQSEHFLLKYETLNKKKKKRWKSVSKYINRRY